jgi:hypothetical protein
MIVVYELCQQGNACVGGTIPIKPKVPPPPPCQGCHSDPFQESTLVYTPLHKRFPSEGTVSAYFRSALRGVTPKQRDAKQDLVLNGEGFLVYGAELKVKSEGQLSWKLQDSIAELQEVRIADATEGKSQGSLVRIK